MIKSDFEYKIFLYCYNFNQIFIKLKTMILFILSLKLSKNDLILALFCKIYLSF